MKILIEVPNGESCRELKRDDWNSANWELCRFLVFGQCKAFGARINNKWHKCEECKAAEARRDSL